MSDLAEYALQLHETKRRIYHREIKPYPRIKLNSSANSLKGIRAVIFDVYGTLINYWRPGFERGNVREQLLLQAFSEVIAQFEMDEILRKINPQDAPAKTLYDFYDGLIAINRQKSADKGATLPEVRLDEVWTVILMILKRNGYDCLAHLPRASSSADFARYLTYTYNFAAMGRELYSGLVEALQKLKSNNMVLGILSDAQLYTPIDLTLLFREQSGGKVDDFNELFDADLTFFSYEYGFVKPSAVLYRRLFDALYEYQITPAQTVFIGNDLTADIKPAAAVGMKTALFCGDDIMAFGTDGDELTVPDIIFSDWSELPDKISFYGETEGTIE